MGNISHTGVTVFQAIFVPLCALLAARASFRTLSGRVPRLSGFLGVLIWSSAAVAIAVPKLTIFLADAVGIGRGADLVFYLAILGGVNVSFYFYQRNRHLENLLTELIRREAIRGAEFPERAKFDEQHETH
jgi:small membrane protein